MEHCAGGDLFRALDAGGGAVTENWCAGVFLQACRGVQYLHATFGVVHNDLKPENILLDARPAGFLEVPRAMIADFGLARQAQQASGGPLGDPRYSAPELFRGAAASRASDVWALGVVLFEMLSGGLLPLIYRRNVSGFRHFAGLEAGGLIRELVAGLRAGRPVDLGFVPGPWGKASSKDLLAKVLAPAGRRCGLDAVLAHGWFAELRGGRPRPLPQEARDRLRRRAKLSKLHVAILNLVAAQMQGRAVEHYRGIWNKYDSNGDGVLQRQEFVDMIRKTGALQRAKSALVAMSGCLGRSKLDPESLFEFADVKGHGHVEFNEFCAIMFDPDTLDVDTKMQYFRSAFAQLAEGGPAVTAEHLQGLFSEEVDPETVEELFGSMDADGDGAVSFAGFAGFVQRL
mmetsp:Transcript_84587/g.263121  ORF Transcript_84587/g.263121 Transcript_84587/m.263121 type:complete len:401 (+) Transcript_84587:423-1625(+)